MKMEEKPFAIMEQRALKNVNSCCEIKISSHLKTYGSQNSIKI